jgi:hypothetical protein
MDDAETISAHQSFATNLIPPTSSRKKKLASTRRNLRNNVIDSSPAISSTAILQQGIANQNTDGVGSKLIAGPDVGSTLRLSKRKQVIESAHGSLARHALSVAEKYKHRELFQNRLRLNHNSGLYEDANWADPSIPSADIGISLEQNLIPSLILPTAVLSELRVSSIDPGGAAWLCKRIKVGDILLKVCRPVNSIQQLCTLTLIARSMGKMSADKLQAALSRKSKDQTAAV